MPAVRRRQLSLEPGALYAAKAVYTRARSARWIWRRASYPPPPGLRILTYHRVSHDSDELAVAPERFREQMDHLADSGFQAVGLAEAAQALGRAERGQTIGLTFDDGYADVLEYALPILAERGFRATVFVTTGATDGSHPFTWYEHPPPVLDWPTIRELDRGSTLDFGAHTVSHPNLLALDDAAAAWEVIGSKKALEAQLGHDVAAFCYPAGLFANRERQLVHESGFRLAVGMEPGVNGPDSDPLALRRTGISGRDGMLDFRAKVVGAHDTPPPLRALYRGVRYGRLIRRSRQRVPAS
jgi:peptidoglycan/xylan/chitin deacetylase (PgdA/CDA1 family)